jgi:hypothetical protein
MLRFGWLVWGAEASLSDFKLAVALPGSQPYVFTVIFDSAMLATGL